MKIINPTTYTHGTQENFVLDSLANPRSTMKRTIKIANPNPHEIKRRNDMVIPCCLSHSANGAPVTELTHPGIAIKTKEKIALTIWMGFLYFLQNSENLF